MLTRLYYSESESGEGDLYAPFPGPGRDGREIVLKSTTSPGKLFLPFSGGAEESSRSFILLLLLPAPYTNLQRCQCRPVNHVLMVTVCPKNLLLWIGVLTLPVVPLFGFGQGPCARTEQSARFQSWQGKGATSCVVTVTVEIGKL